MDVERKARSSDHGDVSGQKSLTVWNCPSIIYFINRTNPHCHWIWAFLSTHGEMSWVFKIQMNDGTVVGSTKAYQREV